MNNTTNTKQNTTDYKSIDMTIFDCIQSNYNINNEDCIYIYNFCKKKYNRHKCNGDLKKIFNQIKYNIVYNK